MCHTWQTNVRYTECTKELSQITKKMTNSQQKNERTPRWAPLRATNTKDQQMPGETLSLTGRQRSAKGTCRRYRFTSANVAKSDKSAGVTGQRRQGAGGNTPQHNHFEHSVHVLVKLNMCNSYDSAVSPLNVFPGDSCPCALEERKTMFTPAFATENKKGC